MTYPPDGEAVAARPFSGFRSRAGDPDAKAAGAGTSRFALSRGTLSCAPRRRTVHEGLALASQGGPPQSGVDARLSCSFMASGRRDMWFAPWLRSKVSHEGPARQARWFGIPGVVVRS